MVVVESGAKGGCNLVVGAEVQDVGQTTVPIAGAARIAEGVGLERASTRIPKVMGIRQPQCMQLAAQSQLRSWPQIERSVQVLVVHHVVKREARVLAWCR